MRHKILEQHRGERFTPAQLRAEFLREFPLVKPASINAADCFNTKSKNAGCTCNECTRLGGFAVNRDGIVDMGASGFGNISPVYTPTGNTRSSVHSPPGIIRISPQDAAECIRQYNKSSYRGWLNTTLDRRAYDLFRSGLSRDADLLLDQIAFVGEQYGGAQERFGSIRKEAELIALNLLPVFDKWGNAGMQVKPLVQGIPDHPTLDFFFSPFIGTKQWPVWASKTLHFLWPHVFPILDSNVKKPLGLKNLVNSSRGYHQFCSIFRDVLLANSEALASARGVDGNESPSDVKLLDKILFQLGLRMR